MTLLTSFPNNYEGFRSIANRPSNLTCEIDFDRFWTFSSATSNRSVCAQLCVNISSTILFSLYIHHVPVCISIIYNIIIDVSRHPMWLIWGAVGYQGLVHSNIPITYRRESRNPFVMYEIRYKNVCCFITTSRDMNVVDSLCRTSVIRAFISRFQCTSLNWIRIVPIFRLNSHSP